MFEKLRNSMISQYIGQLIVRYKEDELAAMSAQITYYLILAFFPFLFFLINLLSFTPLSNKLLISNFNIILPHDTAILVKNILAETVQAKSKTILFLGMLGSLWAASQGMSAIIRGLNHSYGVKESRHFIKLNFIALLSTMGLTAMIIFSFFMIVFGRIIGSYVFGLMGAKTLFYSIWLFLRYGISLTLMLVTFYLIYKYLPNRKLKFNNIMVGTIFTTIGWVSASLLFSFYINGFVNYEIIYGSLGGIFALIIWLYMSTLIFLLGGELNAISSNVEKKKNVAK
ncbi:MAG: putative rane protein [Firmicutes bacterium]|nr:putative rane protein [Bacillota bacterium]